MREGDLPSTFLLLWICHEVPTAFWSWNSAKMLYGSGFNNNPKMQSNAYSGFPSYNGEGKYHFCTIYTGSERKKQPRSVRFFYQKAVLQLLLIPPNQTLHFSNIRKGPPNTGRRDRPPPGDQAPLLTPEFSELAGLCCFTSGSHTQEKPTSQYSILEGFIFTDCIYSLWHIPWLLRLSISHHCVRALEAQTCLLVAEISINC